MNLEKIEQSKKNKLYILVAVLFVVSLSFRMIVSYGHGQTSLLFIGLPALLSLLMIKYSKTRKTAYGVVFQTMTLFLLISSILLGEGIVCILMAAPLFYGIAALCVFIWGYLKKENKSEVYSFVIIPLLIFLSQPFSEVKTQKVETIAIIQNEVSLNDFNQNPNFLDNLPNFFKLGFPKPMKIEGSGTEIGDKRNIQFESNIKGLGMLSLGVVQRTENKIIFVPIKDDTHINQWLNWKQITVEISKSPSSETQIKWTSEYDCLLGPAWYFEPMERYAVEKMNKHLIDAYFN